MNNHKTIDCWIKGSVNVRCWMCDKENRCEYFNILKIPCDDCKYKEQDESSEECRKCINGKCQFKMNSE